MADEFNFGHYQSSIILTLHETEIKLYDPPPKKKLSTGQTVGSYHEIEISLRS
jgi:hypothetical protein